MPRKKTIGIELHALSNLMMRFMENDPEKKNLDSVTGTNGWIIGYLFDREEEDVYQRDLEKEFGITRSTASKVVNLMVKKGLVQRLTVSHDARLKKLVLTPQGKEMRELMDKCGKRMEHKLVDGFSQQELQTLFGYIERMKHNMEE